ncbi:MAG: POT family MFS transporter [bacterium]
MKKTQYLTAPIKTPHMPPGVPYIVVNEAAERFSFYGMRTILVVFMTQYLMGAGGVLDVMGEEEAKSYFHLFVAAVYFTPFFGALLADALLGKYRTIIWLSLVYCLGHLALALDDTRLGLATGLVLIAVGSGGIKPCVSANVGDQFGQTNKHLIERVYGWFYFSINFGSFFSTLLTPWLLEKFGPHVAFAVPGILMFIATVVFWMGRRKYVHIPAGGIGFLKETFSREGLGALGKLAVIYLFVAMFWALYDQTGSAWVLQAEKMDRNWLGFEWLPSQLQAINPILILIFIPLFSYVIYPLISKVFPLTPLRKITIGMFLTAASFLICAWIETRIGAGERPNIVWQFVTYVVMTAAEIFISITSLEFAYTQAPKKMKSFVMSAYLLSISLGNFFTFAVNYFIENPDGTSKLAGADYYLFFAGLMLATAVVFIFVAMRYQEKTYIQDEMEAGAG